MQEKVKGYSGLRYTCLPKAQYKLTHTSSLYTSADSQSVENKEEKRAWVGKRKITYNLLLSGKSSVLSEKLHTSGSTFKLYIDTEEGICVNVHIITHLQLQVM